MGCDIHVVVQRRDGDRWSVVDPPAELTRTYETWSFPVFEDRNYGLFGVLAGVRDPNVAPIAEPRGLPDDAGVMFDGDGYPEINGKWLGQHSFSWVSATELVGYDWSKPSRYSPGETLFDDTGVGRWLPWLLSLADDPAEVRVVFGFDN
jgi:hypothetical protein